VREPLSEEPYVTTTLGETPWILGPMIEYFGDSTTSCASGHVLEAGEILGRPTILFRCTEFESFDTWVDGETGIVLRQEFLDPNEGEPSWAGFTEIEFNPILKRGLFDPGSV
jgi:hypothetical protein